MEKKLVLALAAVIVVLLAGVFFFAGDATDPAGAESVASGAVSADGQPLARGPSPDSFVTGLEQLPNSLQGTEVDGELEVDAGGHLKITNGVRRVFDYFLSTMGEESLETILARIKAYIRHKLPPMAAGEAEALLDKYIAYKRGLENVRQAQPMADGSIDVSAVRNQMQQVQALRTQYFTPQVIAAFFGDEDAYDRYTLDRLDVMQAKGLSPAQRAQQLAALEAQLPSSIRDSMKTVNQYQNLESLTADWKQRGGSAAELRQIRESLVGAEAADRLETLDKDRAAWGQRMDSWYAERDAILANKNLSEIDRQRQLTELRNSRFGADERLRVESLERMRDRGETLAP